ncbi:MAG TPA: ATP-binding protein [Chitinophagaceae bacterium]|jgi:signal transduction histidine kinase|nr:ATP-binding protein [Chitinophagaceae bacterium]
MTGDLRKKMRRATIVYWVLLLYIIAALLWWLFSLEQQNRAMYGLREAALLQKPISETERKAALAANYDLMQRATVKHVSEGIVFLVLILVGALFIYRSVRGQIQAQQQQQNFVMAVTHELKTPISVARLNLETLQKRQLDEGRRGHLVQMTLQETLRLDTLINNILLSAQLEGHSYKGAHEELDFSSLVEHAVQEFRSRYPDRPVTAAVDPDLELTGDPLLLQLLISNLLENAHKYTPRAAEVRVRLTRTGSHLVLEVSDTGPGIADEEKKKVFGKFYRIGNEGTRRATGTGLGLYLCRIIAEAHKASLTLSDNRPKGSIFTVHFTSR